ncbi:profilin [Streptomyces syringium]|uniref:profilin n=1 Tax=Streptomyces syringium TaxID=76729 RepID=UPI00341DCD0E
MGVFEAVRSTIREANSDPFKTEIAEEWVDGIVTRLPEQLGCVHPNAKIHRNAAGDVPQPVLKHPRYRPAGMITGSCSRVTPRTPPQRARALRWRDCRTGEVPAVRIQQLEGFGMDWQAYVDNNLVGTGKIAKAAIFGLEKGDLAASPGFTISPAEQNAIRAGYSKPDALQASGVHLGGEKYFTISVADRTIQAKKGPNGAVVVKTKEAIIVAVYHGPIQAPEVTPTVESLADYLIGTGH